MFSGITYDVPPTGKKIHGLPSRKDQPFSIAWENAPSSLNHFQLRQTKNKEVTAKITTQSIIQGQQDLKPQRQPYELQQKDYERIFYENPNITQEELEKVMAQYDQYQRGVPSRSSKQESSGQGERRVPIRPRQNMKDIIYNGVGVGEEAVRAGGRVDGVICSVIILTSRLIVTIIIQEEADRHLYPTFTYLSLLPLKAYLTNN